MTSLPPSPDPPADDDARPMLPTAMPFVGRTREVSELAAMLGGHRNRCVLLSSAPGVGKTRLASEAGRNAGTAEHELVTVAATPAFTEIPFGAFAALLGSLEGSDTEPRGSLGQTEFLAIAYDTVSERLGSSMLIVDDVQLLDTSSALLLSFLIATATCPIVLTARTTTPLPAPIERLWMDGTIDAMEIEPLSGGDVAALCSRVVAIRVFLASSDPGKVGLSFSAV